MGSYDPSALIGLAVFVVITAAFVALFFITRMAGKALAEFASSRGLTILSKDENEGLEQRVVEKLGVPAGGIYRDIVRLPLSAGEAYLFTKAPERSRTSSEGTTGGSPHHFIVVFMEIPVVGRTFAARAIPITGGLGGRVVEFILNRVFGATGIHRLDIADQFPEFAKIYSLFTEDEAGARSVILSSGVITCLTTYPRKEPVNICIGPNGFGIDIVSLMKSRQEIEQLVDWADDLARVLGDC